MLAKIAPGSKDFAALGRYLVNGKGGNPSPDRVQWVMTRNLGTEDVELASKYMAATAAMAPRTKKPVYHLMIAWHEAENPSADIMQEIAAKMLELAGLADHQALIMAHGDTPHKHLHIMLNRVHPDTLRAWKTSKDYERFDRIMRQLSGDYGFQYIPSHTFDPGLTDELQQLPDSKAYRAAKNGAKTGRNKWSRSAARTFGDYLSEDLTTDSTVADLETKATELGLAFEEKGGGYVLGNGESYATLSSLGLQVSANGKLLARAAPPPDVPVPFRTQRHWWDVDAVDVTRAFMGMGLATRDDLMDAVNDARTVRENAFAARNAKPFLPALLPSTPPRLPASAPAQSRLSRTALSTPLTATGKPRAMVPGVDRRPTRLSIQELIAQQGNKPALARRRFQVANRLAAPTGLAEYGRGAPQLR